MPSLAEPGGHAGGRQILFSRLPYLPGRPFRRCSRELCPTVLGCPEADGGYQAYPAPAAHCCFHPAAGCSSSACSSPRAPPPPVASSAHSRELAARFRRHPSRPPPKRRAGWRIFCFLFFFGTQIIKKEQFLPSLGSKRARMSLSHAITGQPHPPLLSPVGSRARFKEPSPTPPTLPWSQVGVAPHTQTPLRDAMPSESGPCPPPRCPTMGTSVVPLVTLTRFLGAWLALLSPSRWLIRTVRLGYAIQFTRRPPKFRGIQFTSMLTSDVPVLRAEIAVLLAKDAIELVPPADMRLGFCSPYFIVPKKGGGFRPILDLRVLNRALHKLPFKMLTQKRIFECIHPGIGLQQSTWRTRTFMSRFSLGTGSFSALRSRDGHISTRSFPSGCPCRPTSLRRLWRRPLFPWENMAFAFSTIRQLAHSGSVAGSVVWAQGHGAQSPVGTSGQLGKEQTLSSAEDLFSWYGVGLGQPDSTPHRGMCLVNAELLEFSQVQDSRSTETISEAPGAYGIRSRSNAARTASYEAASALASWPSPEMGVATRHTPSDDHSGLSPSFQPMVGPCISTGRSSIVQVSRHAVVCTDASTTGWGATYNRQAALGLWTGMPPSALAHQLPRVAYSTPCAGPLQNASTRQARTGPYRQHCDRCVRQPPGVVIRSRLMSQLARHLHLRSLRAIYISGLLNRAADELSQQHALPGEWRLHPRAIQLIWRHFGAAQVDLFASPDTSHCQWFYSLTGEPSAQMHWHTAGSRAYTSMHFPQWAYLHRHCAKSGRTRSRSC